LNPLLFEREGGKPTSENQEEKQDKTRGNNKSNDDEEVKGVKKPIKLSH